MKMESFGFRVAIILLVHIILLLSFVPVQCDDEEDHLLQGINSFRQSSNVPALAKHDKANCVADEIVDRLEDRQCASNTGPPTQSQVIGDYPSVLRKCKVDINTTTEGLIVPVCVTHRVPTLVLTNYTQSQNSRYLNDSRYTGVGIGTEDDWTVLVLTTNTHGGSFASGACFARNRIAALSQYVPSLLLIMLMM